MQMEHLVTQNEGRKDVRQGYLELLFEKQKIESNEYRYEILTPNLQYNRYIELCIVKEFNNRINSYCLRKLNSFSQSSKDFFEKIMALEWNTAWS